MTKRIAQFILLGGGITFYIHAAYANGDPTTFLGPTLSARYTTLLQNVANPFWQNAGISVLGEAGPRNLRAGGTFGFEINCAQRLKFSVEYLWQKLSYEFFSGDTRQWVQQGAIGGDYQIDLGNMMYFSQFNTYSPQFDLNVYYSHAPNKGLSPATGTFRGNNEVEPFIEQRRIAGSDAGGISPGIRVEPWLGSRLRLFLNYDDVHYHERYSNNSDVQGFGGTIGLNQAILNNLDLDLSAAVRKPFNNYDAWLNYGSVSYYGLWTFGLGGNYTVGKHSLPNSYNVGLSVNYVPLPCCAAPLPDYKHERSYNPLNQSVMAAPDSKLARFIADPAVHMPQVLAVADSLVSSSCSGGDVLLLSPIPNPPPIDTFDGDVTTTISTAPFFSGNNLTFSMTVNSTGDPTITINPATGEITVFAPELSFSDNTITVTASNGCASASSTFLVEIFSSD